ncbi:MAG: SU10 major capsid protein [Cetobacterium sp.]|uniref:SU10 major capsid protein n=1 Tax=Cetobacterium sp. TaxID=2071632 RepID=UPI003EE75446
MAVLKTFNLKGNKQSFANWISNLSPTETPFTSMIGKESVDQTTYSWQIDRLSKPKTQADIQEGSAFTSPTLTPTIVKENFTQIFRKVVRVSDTTKKIGLYGRSSELQYQMEKAGKAIKRDIEYANLQSTTGNVSADNTAGRMFGFKSLCALKSVADLTTGAKTHQEYEIAEADWNKGKFFSEKEIFDMTYNLYMAGSKADKIMVHPKYMRIFSDLIGASGNAHVTRMFDGLSTKYNSFVSKIRDPLGQEYEIIPNRFMPEDHVFFFTPSDWTQMVLREPAKTQLAKNGSFEKWMIEAELGLRHRNPYASGVMVVKKKTNP